MRVCACERGTGGGSGPRGSVGEMQSPALSLRGPGYCVSAMQLRLSHRRHLKLSAGGSAQGLGSGAWVTTDFPLPSHFCLPGPEETELLL